MSQAKPKTHRLENLKEMKSLLEEVNDKGTQLLSANEHDFLERMLIFMEEYASESEEDFNMGISVDQRKWLDDLYEKYNDYLFPF